MVQQKRGIMYPIHYAIAAVWLVSSVVFFGSMAVITSLFYRQLGVWFSKKWMTLLLFFCGVKVIVKGLEKLDVNGRYVFLANHQSYFDIPTLFSGLPYNLSFIAKKELFQIPFFGWAMSAIGHIYIDRKNPRNARASITRAVQCLKHKNTSLVLFPEGTRSADGTVAPFKRGSFTLAFEAGVPVVPVSLVGTNKILPKKSMIFNPGTVTLVIHEPLPVSEFEIMDKAELSERIRRNVVDGLKE